MLLVLARSLTCSVLPSPPSQEFCLNPRGGREEKEEEEGEREGGRGKRGMDGGEREESQERSCRGWPHACQAVGPSYNLVVLRIFVGALDSSQISGLPLSLRMDGRI